jgi:hypothetical protein
MSDAQRQRLRPPLASPPENPGFRWFHLTLSTYGAWLRGDPRGFRTRHHRQHVEGDYKRPPPAGSYARLAQRSRKLMKQPAVELPWRLRSVVGLALIEKLHQRGAFVLCAAVSRQHVHLLVKMPPARVREWCGHAKRHATFTLREHGWKGKLWGVRGKATPVKDRKHQLNVYYYILAHGEQGAWVWKWERPRKRSEAAGVAEEMQKRKKR